ncbi:hypothetical protein [Hoeflea sp. 108]|uniref:hypothetical protein n=1 Tax=Hoeflea sp. 108 TaxID=1116369 RepID=UPI00035C6ADE|nr:hypothetical protein [Hoeflea sp. 108]
MRYLLSCALLLLSAEAASAFTPQECSALLKFGIYDQYDVVESKEKFLATKEAYCSSSKDSGGFTIPIKGVPVEGSASFEDNMCSSSSRKEHESYFFNSVARTINRDIINGFNECLGKSEPGVTYVVHTNSDPKRFNIRFSFKSFGATNSDTVRAIVEGATCKSPILDKSTTDGETFSFDIRSGGVDLSCSRDQNTSVEITAAAVNTEVSTKTISIPAYVPPAPAPTEFTFYSPVVSDGSGKSYALDMCAGWASSCNANGVNGLPAADLWCHGIDLGDATDAKVIMDSPPTMVIGGKVLCDKRECDRVSRVTCSARK